MLSIGTVKSDDDTCFAEEMWVNFYDLDPFASQGLPCHSLLDQKLEPDKNPLPLL